MKGKSIINNIKVNYLNCKSNYENILNERDELEKKYITEHKIINSDGKYPEHIWNIEDEKTFDRANEEFDFYVECNGIRTEISRAKVALYYAEKALIKYGYRYHKLMMQAVENECVNCPETIHSRQIEELLAA